MCGEAGWGGWLAMMDILGAEGRGEEEDRSGCE